MHVGDEMGAPVMSTRSWSRIGNAVCTMYAHMTNRTQASEHRDRRWAFRVRPSSDQLVREAATLEGQSITAFVEESAVARAESVIAEHRAVTLGAGEFARFVEALDTAPVAVPELVDLFDRSTRIPQA